jgi:predicted nucleic acid-binding protein
MESALVDTGVWFAMFDSRHPYYKEGQEKADLLEILQVVVPWPTMYEALRTRLVRNSYALARLETYLKSPAIVYLDDLPYRDAALQLAFESSLRRRRPLSMIDCLIRLLIEDVNVKVHYLATCNLPDFRDVCIRRGVEII